MCKKEELPSLAQTYKLETIVYVSDELMRPYILLNDIEDKPYWRPYGGEKIEDIRIFHKWELEAQKKFRDESRSVEEIDELRNLLMSLSTLERFLELDSDMTSVMLGVIMSKTSEIWYCKDKNIDLKDLDREKCEEDLKIYFNLSMFYVTSFFNTVAQVHKSILTSNIEPQTDP